MLFPRVLDVEERWRLGYALRYFEQSCWMWRLGPDVCFDLKHCTLHFFLDLTFPSHEDAARRLVAQAVRDYEADRLPRIWNLRLSGKKKQIQENANMWAALLTDSTTPVMEFDYIGEDGFVALGMSEEEYRSLSMSEKLESRSRAAKRHERLRCLQFCGYWKDFPAGLEEQYCPPKWATLKELNKALVHKPSWLSAWDRSVRRCLYLQPPEERQTSPLKVIYKQHAKDSSTIPWTRVQVEMKSLIKVPDRKMFHQDILISNYGYTKTDMKQVEEQWQSEEELDRLNLEMTYGKLLRVFLTDL